MSDKTIVLKDKDGKEVSVKMINQILFDKSLQSKRDDLIPTLYATHSRSKVRH